MMVYWWDNIKRDFKKVRWMLVEWIRLAQGRDKLWGTVNIVMKLMFVGPCIIAIVDE